MSEDAQLAMAQLLAELSTRWPENQVEPSLARDRALADLLGDPQFSAPVIHLAGTNGKTSTARMVEALLRAAGLRTGLYTSPHLHHATERIAIDGEPIDDATFLRCWSEIADFVAMVDTSAGELTWFQVMTAIAFASFADAPVDVMVLETGLGGTWDSTNIVTPAVCTLTPIAMDHQSYLGDTLTRVAQAKAGIITAEGVPVLSAVQAPEATAVIEARAAEFSAPLLLADRDFSLVGRDLAVGGQVLDIQGTAAEYTDVFLPLHGRHQAQNATLAVATVEQFLGGRALDAQLVRDGLGAATSPGRLEVLRTVPTVVGDAAHNPQGTEALAAALSETFGFDRVVGVVAVLSDKDVEAMLAALVPVLDHVVLTTNSSPRCRPPETYADLAQQMWGEAAVEVVADLPSALEAAVAEADADLALSTGVLVTGSVVTVADARTLLGRA